MAYNDLWFSGEDIANRMKGLQVWPPAGTTSPDGSDLTTIFQTLCDIAADAIRNDIERKTGRQPLLMTRAVITHDRFEMDGRLTLKVPARKIYSVKVGDNTVEPGLYWTEPSEAMVTGEPITSIRFNHGGTGWEFSLGHRYPNRVAVDAEYGSYSSVPPILWLVGQNMAVLHVVAGIQGEQDLAGVSEEGFSIQSDVVGPIDDKVRREMWPEQYEKACLRYNRVIC